MNDLQLLSTEDLVDRINKLLSLYSREMKNLSLMLNNIERLYKEIVIINKELTKRKIEVDDSCLIETKKTLEIHQESFSDLSMITPTAD